MGFFNKLLGLVNKAEDAIKTVNNAVSNTTPSASSTAASAPAAPSAPKPPPAPAAPKADEPKKIYMYDADCPKTYIAEILSSEFSSYEVRKDVPLSEFGADGRAYDFAIYSSGELKAVIAMPKKNRTRNHPYWNSQKKAKELGVAFVPFHQHMQNEKGYVINSVKRALGMEVEWD